MEKKWTIHDIAKKAGVSSKTVSLVLNGKNGVGKKTQARILSIIDEVGYEPHAGARSLRAGATDSIGVVLPGPIDIIPLSQNLVSWILSELFRLFRDKGIQFF